MIEISPFLIGFLCGFLFYGLVVFSLFMNGRQSMKFMAGFLSGSLFVGLLVAWMVYYVVKHDM